MTSVTARSISTVDVAFGPSIVAADGTLRATSTWASGSALSALTRRCGRP
ncbi:MAG TPA: hypothetical protein VFO97_10470 [Desertimonas sp.]|nr:hypothetical protein [Desertimonas sp.]